MKVLAFAASSSRESINKVLVTHAAERLRAEYFPDAEIEIIDLNDYEMPIYSIDRDRESGVPEPAQRFFDKITAADALLVAYAEHNGHYTAAFKNLFDWTSRVQKKVFQGKPMLAFAASHGSRGGAAVLAAALESAPFFGAEIVDSLSVPRFREVFDFELGALGDPALSGKLTLSLEKLAARLTPALTGSS